MAEHQNIAVNYTYWGHMANFPNSPHSIIATDWGPYSNYSLVVTIAVDHTAAADRIAVEIGPHNCMRAGSMNYCYCWLGKFFMAILGVERHQILVQKVFRKH